MNKRSTENVIELTGVLVDKELEVRQLEDKVNGEMYNAIMGDLILRTKDGSEHKVSVFAKEYNKNNTPNKMFTTYSNIMEGTEVLVSEKEVAQVLENGDDTLKASVVKVGQCKFNSGKLYKSQKTGKATYSMSITGNYFNPLSAKDIELNKQEAVFRVQGIVSSIEDVYKDGNPTGDIRVTINTINAYEDKVNSTETDKKFIVNLMPVKLNVEKELANGFRAVIPVGSFTKVWGSCISLKKTETVIEQPAFGQALERDIVVNYVRNNITGGTPGVDMATGLQEFGITVDEYNQLIAKRDLEISNIENGVNALASPQNVATQATPSVNPFL